MAGWERGVPQEHQSHPIVDHEPERNQPSKEAVRGESFEEQHSWWNVDGEGEGRGLGEAKRVLLVLAVMVMGGGFPLCFASGDLKGACLRVIIAKIRCI